MPVSTEVLNQTLALPTAERGELAHELLLSLKPPKVQDDSSRWEKELLARLEAVESGNYSARDCADSMADMRTALDVKFPRR